MSSRLKLKASCINQVMHVHLFPPEPLLLDKLHELIDARLLGAAEPPSLLHQVLHTANHWTY